MQRQKFSEKGFTLIELMIVIAIIGILFAIAIPSYMTYRMNAGRADARASLMDAAQKAELFFVRNNSYAGAFDPVTFDSGAGRYVITFTVPSAAPDTFILEATPKVGADTLCTSIRINHQGLRKSVPQDASCW